MSKLYEFLKRDSYIFGIILAIAVPLLSTIIIFPLINLMKSLAWVDVHMPISKYLLLCCIPNFILFRHYLKELEMEKTGRAIFVVALIEVVVLLLMGNRSIF